MQTLAPYSRNKHETYVDIDSFFGGSIATTTSLLAVGCQNCNSTEVVPPQQSGEVYLFSPGSGRNQWSVMQILTADRIKFLGEHVAVHNDIIVATGDQYQSNSVQTIKDFPTCAVIYQRQQDAKDGKNFRNQQVLTIPNPSSYVISEIAVFDETVVLSASKYSYLANPNEIYVYYPNTERYGGMKAKSRPVQWSLHQTLSSLGQTYVLNFYLNIMGNNLIYSSFDPTKDQVILYKRYTLGGQWEHTATSGVDVFETDVGTSDLFATLTPDMRVYFTNLGTAGSLFKPIDLNPSSYKCLQITVGDQFGDGWDSAVLSVESPDGSKVTYSPRCDSYNPIMYRYCPHSGQTRGLHKLRVENVENSNFPWEIWWKVYDERAKESYLGTYETGMDFEWSEQFLDFTPRRMRNIHINDTVCTLCSPGPLPRNSKPKPKPKLSVKSRHLHGKEATSSPTLSPAPTIEVTGLDTSLSLQIKMSNSGNDASPWFSSENSGTNYYISDVDGKNLYASGTLCVSGMTEVSCWAELKDGEYVIRVGGALDDSNNRQWKFCGGIHYQGKQTELFFSVKYGICYPSLARSHASLCNNVLKVTMLSFDIVVISEAESSVKVNDLTVTLKSYIDNYLHKRIGQVSSSTNIISSSTNGAVSRLTVLVGVTLINEVEMLSLVSLLQDGGDMEIAPASLEYKLFLQSIAFADEVDNFYTVDESSFQLVSNFVQEPKYNQPEGKRSYIISFLHLHEFNAYVLIGMGIVACLLLKITINNMKGDVSQRTESVIDLRTTGANSDFTNIEGSTKRNKKNKKKYLLVSGKV